MNNILAIEKHCVGCGTCELVCPKKCIKMEVDKEGFLYPIVDERECNHCGSCFMKCAQAEKRMTTGCPHMVYAIKNRVKTDIIESASGGAADVAAKVILDKGGIVFGAAYNDKMAVQHIAIEKDTERSKLRSSKYVQSDMGDCFFKAKSELDAGRLVLFTGTPCQIDSLYSFLGTQYDNLYTIDLVCHGVPSPVLFKKYIEYMGGIMDGEVIYYNFRSKEKKGWGTHFLLKTKTKEKTKTMSLDRYGFHFLKGDCYRECCYSCQYANLNRPGDLTVGDFWGVEKFYPKFFSPDGVSEVLVNTEKGMELFNSMMPEIDYVPIRIEEILYKNGNLRHPSHRPDSRDTFYSNIQEDNFIEKLSVSFQWKVRLKEMMPRKLIVFLKRYLI